MGGGEESAGAIDQGRQVSVAWIAGRLPGDTAVRRQAVRSRRPPADRGEEMTSSGTDPFTDTFHLAFSKTEKAGIIAETVLADVWVGQCGQRPLTASART